MDNTPLAKLIRGEITESHYSLVTKYDFNIGDRVRKTTEYGNMDIDDKIGTIVVKTNDGAMIGIKFDDIRFGHNLDGALTKEEDKDKGWYVPIQYLEKVEEGDSNA